MDDPMPVNAEAAVPLSEVEIRASRSSGPGGQHANVTASRVEAIFNVAASPSLTEAQKQRLAARLGPRVVAVAQDARSQSRNRELALERLRRRLSGGLATRRPRHPSRPTKSSVQRRLAGKRQRSDIKRGRQRPGTDD
jgi:ribosome-associated protein